MDLSAGASFSPVDGRSPALVPGPGFSRSRATANEPGKLYTTAYQRTVLPSAPPLSGQRFCVTG